MPKQALQSTQDNGSGEEKAPDTSLVIISNPPVGCKRVLNIYVNADGKLIIEYDTDTGG